MKKTLIEWGLITTTVAILYFGGWHTEIIGRMQQGILFSGLFNPSLEKEANTVNKSINQPNADFTLKLRNQDGELVKMEDLRGKVIFINLWATWCPPCIAEMPAINELSKKMKGEEIIFLMVSMDENFNKAKDFRKRKDFSFEVYELASSLPEMYYSQSIPSTYVISADGKQVFTKKGMADYNTPKFQEFLRKQQ